jgi:hypothetical protein
MPREGLLSEHTPRSQNQKEYSSTSPVNTAHFGVTLLLTGTVSETESTPHLLTESYYSAGFPLINGILGNWPTAKCWYHFPLFAKNLQPATFYFISRQFGPAFKSTTRGTASSCTCSIALRTSGRRRSISPFGASNSSSSWTCRIILA